jgi:hypothetical protein
LEAADGVAGGMADEPVCIALLDGDADQPRRVANGLFDEPLGVVGLGQGDEAQKVVRARRSLGRERACCTNRSASRLQV